jgi:hypothetical protein
MSWIAAVGARGQVITQPPPPGGGEIYGPTNGRDWVIANAGPSATTDPGGGVTFTTLADLETKINANPSGTKFVRTAGGTITWSNGVACGAKAPKLYFLGLAGSTSTVINGGGLNITGIDGNQTGAPVEIHGGRWTNFGSAGGGEHHVPFLMRDGWLAEDFVTDTNFFKGFRNQGSNVIVRRAETHSNGSNGWGTNEYVSNGPKRVDNLYEHIDVHNNNTRNLSPDNFAGGCKMLQCARNIGRYIYCHDENAWGLWFDTAEGGTLHTGNGFEECVVEDCARSGLFLEGVGSGAFLKRNWVKNNGRGITIGGQAPEYGNSAQIRLSCSDMTLGGAGRGNVSRNYVDYTLSQTGTLGGLLVMHDFDGHPDRSRNWDIFQNQWWLRSATGQSNGRLTGRDEATTGVMMSAGDNDFFDNEYHVANTSLNNWQWFLTGTRTESGMNYSTWQTHHPGDDIPQVLI